MEKIRLFVLTIILMLLPFTVKAEMNLQEEQIKALLETANAYYRQENQLQYDSFKKNLNSTPEDATSKHYTYTVCSGFTYQVYKQTLGIDIPDTTNKLVTFAKNNQNSSNVLFYYQKREDGFSKTGDFVNKIVNVAKPGDILVYYKSSGHSMLVTGVDKTNKTITVLEGGGGRYDIKNHVDKYDKNGAISKNTKKSIGSIFPSGSQVALLRFITDGKHILIQVERKRPIQLLTKS